MLSGIILSIAGKFWILALTIIVTTAFFTYGMGKLRIENDIMFMLPDSNPEKQFFVETQERFGSSTGIAIAVSSADGIYHPLFLEKIREAGDRIARANQVIPAGQIETLLPLTRSQALVLTVFLQNLARMEGRDVVPEVDWFTDRALLSENLAESLPFYLAGEDALTLIGRTVETVSAAVGKDPKLAEKLFAIITRPTDNRGFTRGAWVDQVSSVMESDTVWPELYDFDSIDTFFVSRGFSDVAAGRNLSVLILERGFARTDTTHDFITSALPKAPVLGIPPAFRRQLTHKVLEDPGFAYELQDRILSSPRQIRTGKLFRPGESTVAELRHRLHAWSLFEGTLYNENETSALLLVKTEPNLNQKNKELLLREVRHILEDVFENTDFSYVIAGEPVVDYEVGNLMIRDIIRLFPVVILVVACCLGIMFKNLSGVLYPLLTVLVAFVWCFGAMGFAKVPVSIVSSALPVLLVSVGTAYAIHLTLAFQQGQAEKHEPLALAGRVLHLTGGGVLMAGLTTVAGFSSLAVNQIVPLRDFGIFIGLGVVFALILSLCLIPALMIRFPGRSPMKAQSQNRSGNPIIASISIFCCNWPRTVLTFYLFVVLLSAAGLSQLRVDMNNIMFFKKDAPIRQADTFINNHFAGTTGLSVVFAGQEPGDAVDPDIVRVLETLSLHLYDKHPEIGKVVSLADMVKKMHQAFHDNDPAWYRLPEKQDLSGEKTRGALHAQYEAYIDKYQRKDIKSLMDASKTDCVLSIQMKTASSTVVEAVRRSTSTFLDGPAGEVLRERGVTYKTTGPGILYLEANQLIVKGQLWSIAVSLALVFMVVAWVMKSFLYGMYSLIPLSVTILVAFGIMGFSGISLDVGTAITACVAIGIGIDYSIHYLIHYRDNRSRDLDHIPAVLHTAASAGKAIFLNATAVTSGFLVLMASAFVPLNNLGLLISITMISSALAATTLLPAVLTLAGPRGHARLYTHTP